MQPRFRLLSCLLVVPLACGQHSVWAKPPTLDPTYGMPIPHLKPSVVQNIPPAQWIWETTTQGSQTVIARGRVTLRAVPHSATVFATGDDSVTVFVNGHCLSTTDAKEQGWKQVQRASVAAFLHTGMNVVAAQGVNGGGAAGILIRLDADGKTVLQTDPHWKVK